MLLKAASRLRRERTAVSVARDGSLLRSHELCKRNGLPPCTRLIAAPVIVLGRIFIQILSAAGQQAVVPAAISSRVLRNLVRQASLASNPAKDVQTCSVST